MTDLDLEATLERIQDAWREEVAYGEWAAFQLEELRERLTITDDMVERARRAMYHELNGQYGDFTTPTIGEARAVLEAALGEENRWS